MAEFCSQCTPFEMADFELTKMAIHLERGHSHTFPCEGCANRAIYKDEEGRLWLAKAINRQGDLDWKAVDLDEL
ncbi:unnamed protein product [Ectocarpus fasciculatus]